LIEAELTLLPVQIADLQVQHTALSEAYKLAADESQALSATLEIGPLQEAAPQIVHLRPVSTLLLVGGFLGVLALGVGWLVQIARKSA
jgi:hypothetical protein